MKKSIKAAAALLMIAVMIFGICGCGAKKEEEKPADNTKRSALTFTGDLIDAQGDRLVIKDPRMALVVYTTPGTEYDLQGYSEICVRDTLTVEFHKNEKKRLADKIILEEHKERSLVFGGEVTEIGDEFVTVQSESLTVVFNTDDDTEIEGDLTRGDAVTVTYEGNLSTNPFAKSIVVVEEKEEKLKRSLHGTVSETGKKSFVVSVDSAHACRIRLTKKTKITGDAKELRLGDEVHVVYTGEIQKDAVAVSIKITRGKVKYFIMDGVIVSAAKDKMVIQTAKKKYDFKIVKDTRIENEEYMKAGHMTTVTYIGDLNKDPVAASIFCSKDTAEKQQKKSEKKDSKKEEKKKEKKEEEKDDGGVDPEDPDIVLIEATGEVVEWDDPCEIKIDGGATLKLDIKDAYVAAGYVPRSGDQVTFSYDKDSMKLYEIMLEYRPVLDADTVVVDEADAEEDPAEAEEETGDQE